MSTTRKALDQDLLEIRDNILRMASLLDTSVERAIEALRSHSTEVALAVVSDDDLIDSLHAQVEEQVTQTFALQQPMARDLRKLIADLLISNELERMADHAEGIARAALRSPGGKAPEIPDQIGRMKAQVLHMIRTIMSAYVDMDAEAARVASSLDNEVDSLYQSLFNHLVHAMTKGKISVEDGTYLLWAGHNLERIGDRTTNIAERIVYAHTGAVADFNPKPGEHEDSGQS
jgi:phosphate transport system protein